jgi:CubicO group peptidase (beta-lactamase class C family)
VIYVRRSLAVPATLVILLGLVGCGSDAADDSSTGTSSSRGDIAGLDRVFPEVDQDEPGCAGAVSVDGEVVWTASTGAASLETLEAIDDDTVFDIGSVSKQFTATAILLLVDQGELALEDTLSDHLTELPVWADEVTIDQLLHHQGGIPDYIDLLQEEGYEYTDATTVDDAMQAIATVEDLDFEPGSRFEYSNTGYFLLSQVAEAVTQTTLGDYLAKEVFGPLDLDATMDATTAVAGQSTSYTPDEDDDSGFAVADSHWEQTGDGAVRTTPSELVRWAPELWDSQLADGLAEARLTDAVDDGDGDLYGAGIYIAEDEDGVMLWHSGSWSGFQSSLVVLPEVRLAAAVSCNRDDDVVDAPDIAQALIAAYQGTP